MCGCLPEALDLIGKGLFNEVSASSDVSATTSSILGQYAQLQTVGFTYWAIVQMLTMRQCFLDNACTVQDNKAALLTSGALSASGGWTVIKAAEVGPITVTIYRAETV